MLHTGSTTTKTIAAIPSAAASRVGIAPPGREEAGRPPREEQDHRDEDRHLAEDRAERRLDTLGDTAEPRRREERPGQQPDAARDAALKPFHDVVRAMP